MYDFLYKNFNMIGRQTFEKYLYFERKPTYFWIRLENIVVIIFSCFIILPVLHSSIFFTSQFCSGSNWGWILSQLSLVDRLNPRINPRDKWDKKLGACTPASMQKENEPRTLVLEFGRKLEFLEKFLQTWKMCQIHQEQPSLDSNLDTFSYAKVD